MNEVYTYYPRHISMRAGPRVGSGAQWRCCSGSWSGAEVCTHGRPSLSARARSVRDFSATSINPDARGYRNETRAERRACSTSLHLLRVATAIYRFTFDYDARESSRRLNNFDSRTLTPRKQSRAKRFDLIVGSAKLGIFQGAGITSNSKRGVPRIRDGSLA